MGVVECSVEGIHQPASARSALAFAGENVEPLAVKIGAVNTLVIDGRIYGFARTLEDQVVVVLFNAGPDAVLRDVAWRPGCDGGFIVGGDATGGLVIAFDVETGVACD